MSYTSVQILEKKKGIAGKPIRMLYFSGVDWGAPLEIVAETDKAVMVWQRGHSSYLNRASGSVYTSPSYKVFAWGTPLKNEVINPRTNSYHPIVEIEYVRGKGNRETAEKKARECFDRINTGEIEIFQDEQKKQEEEKALGIVRVHQQEKIARYRAMFPKDSRPDADLLKDILAAEEVSRNRKAEIIEEWVFRRANGYQNV